MSEIPAFHAMNLQRRFFFVKCFFVLFCFLLGLLSGFFFCFFFAVVGWLVCFSCLTCFVLVGWFAVWVLFWWLGLLLLIYVFYC